MTPTPAIGKDDLLQELRDLETALGTAEVENLVAQEDEPTRRKFVALREQVTVTVGALENAQLADIAARLDQLSPDLNTGIAQLKKELKSVASAIAIINAASGVLGLAGRVAALV
jgi:uncharacterized phage infection (PIP) family protein YhgE